MTRDTRLDALNAWLERVLPAPKQSIAPASFDASFRRYFRVTLAQEIELPDSGAHASTLIAMDAPPPHENCGPYVAVARLLSGAGVHAPVILARDLEQGFLLLSDLGTQTYLSALGEATAAALYRDATSSLLRWQLASRAGVLPRYDKAILLRELDLFPEWYVSRHLGISLNDDQQRDLRFAFGLVLDNNLAQQCVYVHRDYHSRNLMVCAPNPGVLDFQDAVYGPITYDLVSLLRDAYIAWDEERQLDWAVRYWERAREAGLPVDEDFAAFWRDFEWMGVQRQLKVLGIFARLYHRDGKAGYLEDMPRVMMYLRGACARYRELLPLARLLDQFEARAPVVGYSF